MIIRLTLALAMWAASNEAGAQLRPVVNEGRPIVVAPGGLREFPIDIHRPVGFPESGYTTSFRDPSTSGRPTFLLGFGEIRDGRCNADFGVDFTPEPNFAGWFGAMDIEPGETLRCRVEVGAHPAARPGEYAVLIDGAQFTVIVVAPRPTPVPTLGGHAMLLLTLVFAGTACCRLRHRRLRAAA